MKESIPQIKDKIKKALSFKNINPHKHWRNLLYVFFVAVIFLVVFSFYILYEIKNQQIFQVKNTPEEQKSLINEKLLDQISKSFNSKLSKQLEIESGPFQYKDPSFNN